MSGEYSARVHEARTNIRDVISGIIGQDERKRSLAIERLPAAVDALNKAWDELTDCLVRQRDTRGEELLSVLDELAEARK